jgi:hypothetical protein
VNRYTLALLALLATPCVSAQPAGLADKRQLLEQKIRLVEMLINSQATKNKSASSPDAPERLEKSRTSLELARQAMSKNLFDEAGQILDDALRISSSSRRESTESNLSDEAHRHAYQNLIEQVATYRASVEDLLTTTKTSTAARLLLGRIDAKSAEARKFAGDGRLDKANKILGEAYQLAVSELSRLRAGEEVVLTLNFATPSDEYAYELRRFDSSQILIKIMLSDGTADSTKRSLVDKFVNEGFRLREEAEGQATAGHYKEAIRLMEGASTQINRGLQSVGVPVF